MRLFQHSNLETGGAFGVRGWTSGWIGNQAWPSSPRPNWFVKRRSLFEQCALLRGEAPRRRLRKLNPEELAPLEIGDAVSQEIDFVRREPRGRNGRDVSCQMIQSHHGRNYGVDGTAAENHIQHHIGQDSVID